MLKTTRTSTGSATSTSSSSSWSPRKTVTSSRRRALYTLVLAAGIGKRMKSRRIKLLHEIAGRPMLSWVLDALRGVRARGGFIVLGHQADLVRKVVEGAPFRILIQRAQRRTGPAVL